MQPRRFGSLLPLVQALLTLVVGCVFQSADPQGESTQDPAQTRPDQSVANKSAPTPDALQHVESIPALQQTSSATRAGESISEIVQTHYRPTPADPLGTFDLKPPDRVEYGRAQDYRWLQGELLFSSVRGVWRLRYAASDDDDLYGGSVTLLDVDASLGLQAGQRVRVQGRLINPRSNEPSPFYHVLKLEKK